MSVNAIPDPPPDKNSKEPAMKVAGYTTIGTFATALVLTLVAFGVDMSPAQQAALLGLVGSALTLAPLVSGWFTRREVYAPATVAGMLKEAHAQTAQAERMAPPPPPPPAPMRWPDERLR